MGWGWGWAQKAVTLRVLDPTLGLDPHATALAVRVPQSLNHCHPLLPPTYLHQRLGITAGASLHLPTISIWVEQKGLRQLVCDSVMFKHKFLLDFTLQKILNI